MGNRGTLAPAIAALVLVAGPATAATPPAPAVLVVDPEDADRPGFTEYLEALRDALRRTAPAPVTLYTLHLDLSRFGHRKQLWALDALVRAQYRDVSLGAVVAGTDASIPWALRWRDALWPGVAVLCLATGERGVREARAAPRTAVLRLRLQPEATLRAALTLFPQTRHVAVVDGSEAPGRVTPDFREAVAAVDPRLERIDLVGLPMDELRRRVASLPDRTVILYDTIYVDGDGRRWAPRDALEAFAPRADAPIFGNYGTYLGHGVVGGLVLDFASLGQEVADRVLRLLAGEPAESIPTADSGSLRLQLDHRELERWGVTDDRLPGGSEILFAPPSFWQQHRGKVVAAGLALLLQSLAIVSLLLERRRRLAAQRRLRLLSGRLITAQEEERSRIARDLHDDAGQRLALLAIELDEMRATRLADQARTLSSDLHRMAHQLHPASLQQLGLLPAARRFAEELGARNGIAVELSHQDGWPRELPRDTTLVLYRVMQEALQNVVKHSGATRARVSFETRGDGLALVVADLGRGFDPVDLEGSRGLGLTGMRERLRLVGGELRVDSTPGGGTVVEARVPGGTTRPGP